jgi:DUF1680 family protein
VAWITVGSFVPAEAAGLEKPVELRARPFDLKQVRLLDGPFKGAMDRDRKYLHSLDPDRLLHTWRLNAGLPSDAEPLGGWERPDCQVRGHSLGHYLSACALMYASTGDEKLKRKADGIVAELAECQRAIGNGYLSAFPESHFERAEQCQPVWAPYYCIHKTMAGLVDMYAHCGNGQALEIVCRMAAWCKSRCDRLSQGQMQQMLNRTEQGGMNEVLANLYAITADPEHLALSRRFVQDSYNDPLAEGRDELKGQHVNSFIPNMIGTARQYELTGNDRDRKIAEFFWNQVTGARCYCTGGTSNHEHWRSEPHALANELSDNTQETCCTYNMLKLTRHLFCWEPQPKYADYYERALLNSILSTQDPEMGMMMYFVTLAPGRWKYFNLPNESFWCCTGTGMENHAKYGDSIYFYDDRGLFVNLFIASELDWREKGIRIRQDTRFPEEHSTRLTVHTDKPVDLALRVRVPCWANHGVSAQLNAEPLKAETNPASYLVIRRTWQDGDQLEVTMPMTLYTNPMPDDSTLVAFMYGPLVLAGKLGGEGLTQEMTYTTENWYRFPRDQIAQAPMFVVDSDHLNDWIKPVEGEPLTFRTEGQTRDVTLVPYHRLFGERYAVYWRVYKRGSPEHQKALVEEEARKRFLARCVDEVEIGDRHSESAHELKGDRTQAGPHLGRYWRHATDGGWFSYVLKVLPDKPMTLRLTYWGSDAGMRTFDILVDGQKLATQTLSRNRPEEFFDVEHELPDELTQEREKITVTFQAHPGNFAGGVFGCAVLKPEQ